MSRNVKVSVLVCLLSSLGVMQPRTGNAQRVWVGEGGVRVRAPFVRVDVGPYGGVSVRAPFAAVDVPPRGYYLGPEYGPPVIVERPVGAPSYPSAADFAAMDSQELSQALVEISRSLHDRLNRFDTGATWQRYLRLPEEVVEATIPPEERIDRLAMLLDRFHKVADDPQYPMIARLPAFQAMEAALNEAVARSLDSAEPSNTPAEDLPLPPQQQPGSRQPGEPFLKPRPPQ